MKSEKSVAEIEIEKLIIECRDIVNDSYLTTNDAKRIMIAAGKVLHKCAELRKSRDNWREKIKYEYKKDSSMRIEDYEKGL